MNDVRLGVEVELLSKFSVIKETLERMGVISKEKKKFFPSCYLVECDNNVYKIFHFKELFTMEGKDSTYEDKDRYRRNTICFLLQKWGLIKMKNSKEDNAQEILVEKVDILPHAEKERYRICHKYLFKREAP